MKILEFPELRQVTAFDCGASALQAVLAYYGIERREDCLMAELGTNPEDGTEVGAVVRLVHASGLACRRVEDVDDIKVAIDGGYPVIVALEAYADTLVSYSADYADGHYAVAIGYNETRVVFEDPSAFTRTFLLWEEFEDRWHDSDADGSHLDHWGLVVMGSPTFRANEQRHMA